MDVESEAAERVGIQLPRARCRCAQKSTILRAAVGCNRPCARAHVSTTGTPVIAGDRWAFLSNGVFGVTPQMVSELLAEHDPVPIWSAYPEFTHPPRLV